VLRVELLGPQGEKPLQGLKYLHCVPYGWMSFKLVVMGQASRTPWKEGTNAATSALIYRILYTDRTDSRPLSGRLVDDNCSRIKSNKGSLWIVASQPVDRPLPIH
jgi:hypothetical protein